MSSRNMAMLSSVSSNAAMSVRVGTNAAVPRPICAVETNASRNVAMKVLRAYLSVGLVRNQPRNRGENSLVPNWTMRRTMEVTNPVNASMPLPSAESAALALPALMARVRTRGSASSHRKSPTLSASARMTYTAGINQSCSTVAAGPGASGIHLVPFPPDPYRAYWSAASIMPASVTDRTPS